MRGGRFRGWGRSTRTLGSGLLVLLALGTTATAQSCVVADPSGTPLNLRAAPRGPVVGTLANGMSVTILDTATVEGKRWNRVQGSGVWAGWVISSHLRCGATPAPPPENGTWATRPLPAKACLVSDPTGTPLNLRAAPGGPVLSTLANGTAVSATAASEDERWLHLQTWTGAPLGWAFARHLDCGAVAAAVPPTRPAEATKGAFSGNATATPVVEAVARPPSPALPAVPAIAGLPETRVALVIGNGAYGTAGRLENPSSDAAAVAEAFRRLAFKTVTLRTDLGHEALRQTLRDFAAEAARADWAVVYYAGHGMEMGGVNYLIPVDARLASDRDIQFEAVPLDSVLASVEGARKLQVVILDACRDNPFATAMKRSMASRSVGKGLARIEPESGSMLVAYAAKAGQVASDGAAGRSNSPFVSALLKNVGQPGIEIRKLFGLVRDDVLAETAGRQEPSIYGSLGGADYFFTPPARP